jgi:hypothetical protein
MPVSGGASPTLEKRSLRCDVSLKQRTIQRSGVTTRCVIDALSLPVKANPVAPEAMFIACPITPPWATATTT